MDGDKVMEFVEMIRGDIEFWKSKEQEWRKMASDSRKHWKKAERELKKLEARGGQLH